MLAVVGVCSVAGVVVARSAHRCGGGWWTCVGVDFVSGSLIGVGWGDAVWSGVC